MEKNISEPASYQNNVFHESEKQRQHIRIGIPSDVVIDGQKYALTDLSAGGFKIASDKADTFTVGSQQDIQILFRFNSFSFTLDARALPIYVDTVNGQVGFRFHNLDRQQISLLQNVIKSYLAGQIVTSDNILNVASRDNFMAAKPAKIEDQRKKAFKTYLLMAFIALLGLGSLLVLSGNIYESATIVKSYSGVVDGNIFTLRANTNGTFKSLIGADKEFVKKNDAIAEFSPQAVEVAEPAPAAVTPESPAENGDAVEADTAETPASATATGDEANIIYSPCDCVVTQHSARDGEFRAMGEALFKLLPENEETWVIATLPPESVYKLKIHDNARVRIVGETKFLDGTVAQFLPQDGAFTKVKIKMAEPIKAELVGRPAYVEIKLF